MKQLTFSAKTLRSVLHALVPSIGTAIVDTNLGFPYFTAIDSLFSEGMKLPKQEGLNFFRTIIPRLVKAISEGTEDVLLFETPEMITSNFLPSSKIQSIYREHISCNAPMQYSYPENLKKKKKDKKKVLRSTIH